MKHSASDSHSDSAWEKKLQRARADRAPEVDVPALLSAVRREPWSSQVEALGYAESFTTLFADRRVFRLCLGGAGLLTILSAWPAWECWQEFAWIQMLAPVLGGGS